MANYFNTAANQQFASLPAAAAAASDIRNQFARTDIARASQADSERRTDLAYQTAASDQAYRREQIEQVRQAAAQDAEAAKQRMDRQQMMDAAQQRLNIKAVIEGEIAKNGTLSPQTFQALQDFLVAEDPDAGGQAQLMQYSPEAVETMIAGFEGNFGAWFAENPVPMPAPEQPELPASVQSLQWRAQEAGLQPGTPEYREFIQTGGKMPEGFAVTLPDGTKVAQGNIGDMKFSEGQAKDNVFVTRAEGALSLLDSVGAGALTSRFDRGLDAVPFGLARGAQSEDFQVAQQSGDEFLQAILRKDTGAAITEGEQDLYGKTYLPQPGDGPRVIEAKRQSRIRAVEALKSGMNMQQLTVSERANVEAARRAEATKPAGAQDPAGNSNIPPAPEAVEILKSNPTDEYKRFFDEVFGAGAAERALSQ